MRLFYNFICFHLITNHFADPEQRISLANVAEHPWVVAEEGPIPPYLCWCGRNRIQRGMMP